MTRYLWKNGQFELPDGTPMHMPERDGVCMPRVMSDIPEYRSPVGDHAVITSRSQQRDDLKRHDCVIAPPPAKRREPRSAKYRAAHGLKPLEN